VGRIAHELGALAVWRGELDPGDLLAASIGGQVADAVVGVDVPPVDAAVLLAGVLGAAAGLEQQRGEAAGILLVLGEPADEAQLVAVVLGRPVAALAGVARRAQGVHG
jgi:hypothetical protein